MRSRPRRQYVIKAGHSLVLPGFLLFGLGVFYPALTSYFFKDDFVFLAISRYIHNPLAFFYNDHFPGSFYYRPFGVLSWWLSYKLFGTQYVLHNLVNILIHIANTYILFRIFGLVRANMQLNILLALLFLVHPLTISTSMWLSDRFDLLATLFILSTLYWFLRYRLEGARAAYFLALAACILAALSKELAYFTPFLVTIVAWYAHPATARRWRIKLSEIAPFYGAVLLVFSVRLILLRGTDKLLLGENSFFTVLAGGVGRWLQQMPDFFIFYTDFAQWGVAGGMLLVADILILAALSLLALFKLHAVNWSMVAVGLTIILATAILQAPVTFNSIGPRFYYLSFIGFLLVAQQFLAVASSVFGNPNTNATAARLVYCLLLAQAIAFGALSHSLCRNWSTLTNGTARKVVEQSSFALESLSLPQNNCKLYILNTPSDSQCFRDFSDSIIKAIAPRQSRVVHCLVLAEKTPWFQLMLREDLETMQTAPLRNALVAGQPFAPTLINNLAFLYLNVPDSVEVALDSNAVFVEFDGRQYVDVSQQVKSGSKKVSFFSDRP